MMNKEQDPNDKSIFNKKTLIRLVTVIALIALAVAAFTYAIGKLVTAESGYREVECTANATNCSSEFIFTYNLGVSGMSPTAELKAVTNLYNERAMFYYRVFHPTQEFDGMKNVASLNTHPNETLTVPAELYASLEKAAADGERNIYLAPFFAYYETLFASSYDEDAATWDPARNAELKAEYEKTLSFVSDPSHAELTFGGENKVTLKVSDAYLAYAKEVGITTFIDFFWMKNAFIADLFASDLIAGGYVYGSIASRDGYVRNLDESSAEYAFDFFDLRDSAITHSGKLVYKGKAALCSFHSFILDDVDKLYTYYYSNGDVVTRYVSPENALTDGQGSAMLVYSRDMGCVDLLFAGLECYRSGSLTKFKANNAGAVFSSGGKTEKKSFDGFSFTEG